MEVFRPLSYMVKLSIAIFMGMALVCGLLGLFTPTTPQATAAPLAGTINSDITVDTTWYYTDSPYIILTNTVSILNNAVLTIEPGVEVRFSNDAQLHVQSGQLIAIGTPSRPITFTSDSLTPSRGIWEGIIFGTNAQTSTLQNTLIEYPRGAVQIVNNGNAPIYVYSSTIRYAGDNDNDLSTGGAIIGGPDVSQFSYNRIYSSEVGIRLQKSGTNLVSHNEIYDIDGYCVGVFPSQGLNSANIDIQFNTIYNCRNNGIRLVGIGGTNKASWQSIIGNVISNTHSEAIYALNQNEVYISDNIIFNTALTTSIGTAGTGSNLGAIALIQPEDYSILNNQIYDNGGSGGTYRGAVYIADTFGSGPGGNNLLYIYGNHIQDNLSSGLVYSGIYSATPPFETFYGNAICVTDRYEIENGSTASVYAGGSWLGTNFPAAGTEITGTVNVAPSIQLATGAAPIIVPADGLSAAVITMTMNDGVGHTVPASARQIDLTTDLGTLADTTLALDGNGNGSTQLTSTTPGTATITVTESCGYVVTTTVVFQATDVEISKSTAITQMFPGQTITYTIPYTNNAGVAATNVVITDTLPTGVQWLTDTAESEGFTRSQTSPEVVWTHPSLPGGASGSITLVGLLPDTATATCGTTLTNSVVITTAVVESDITNNSGSAGGVQVLCADVGVTKSTALTQILPGDTVTYTIAYSNSGNAPAQNLVITDTLPTNVTWLTDTADAAGFTRQQTSTAVGWSLPSLAAGNGGAITLVGQAQPTIGCGDILTNSVTISTTTFDSNAGNQSASNADISTICADVTINKVGPAGTILAGDTITYTLTYSNIGTAPATNVVITDVNPISSGIDTLVNGITLNPGQGGSVDYPVVVNPAICAANPAVSITNTGFISTDTPEGDSTNNSSAFSNNVQCLPDLVITKTRISDAASLGRPLTFTLEYRNTGVYTAPNTILTDTLPAGVIYLNDTSGLTPITNTGTVAWNLGDVGPGDSGVFEVAMVADTVVCTTSITFINQVEIDSAWPDANPGNNIDAAASNVILCDNVDLIVSKNDGVGGPTQRPFVWAGDVITYTITYLNVGGEDATGVVLTETLPAYTTFVGEPGWTQVGTTSQYTYDLGTVPSMNGDRLYFIVQVDPSLPATVTVVNNEIWIGSNEPDNLPADNVSYEQTPVQATADLAVEKTSLTPVAHPGGFVTYAITVTNQGSVTATNVVITDTLPATGTTYVTNTVIGAPVSVVGNTVVWNVGQLDPGQTLRFDLTLQVDSGTGICVVTSLVNTVEAQTDVPEGDYSNNTASTSASSSPAVACRDVEITKTVDDPQTTLDRDVVFTLEYGNPALITATNVVVTDTLPAGLTFVGSNPSYSSSLLQEYQWNLPDLPPGITNTIVITAHTTVDSGFCGDTLTNTAVITTTFSDAGVDEYPGNNVSVMPVTIRCVPDLVIVKNDQIGAPWEPPFVQVGDVFTYSIIYSNIGIGPASDVVITETLPAATAFRGPVGWTQVASTNLYTYYIGDVPEGAGALVEFAVEVMNYPLDGFITNTVCIGTPDDEIITDRNCSSDQTLVDQNRPRLNVTKSANPAAGSTVLPSDTITYTVVVLNDGLQPANNVRITDTLPLTEVSFVTATLSSGDPVYGPNPLTATVSSLPVNSAVTMTVEVLVNNVISGTLITNTAEAIADTLSVQQSLPVTHVVETLPVITTNLAITKTGQIPTVTVGNPATYDITVTNRSGITATNVVITDTMPSGSGYLSDTSGLTATVNLNTVSWNVGQLDPGETYTFSLTLSTNQTACVFRPLTNTITVGSDEFDIDLADNIDTATTGIFCNDPYITKVANTPLTTPDQDVVFTLTYVNPGLVTATNVVVSDTLPSGISFVNSTPTHSGPYGGQYRWTPGDVGPGITGTIVITGHVGAGVACDSVLTNTAIITTTATDENPLNNTATAAVTVRCGVDMSLVKNDGVGGPTEPPFVQFGDVITYGLSYNNLGTGAGNNVVITETLPMNTNFVGPTGPNGWYLVGGNQYTYTLNTVNAGNGGVVNFVVEVTALPPGGFITNTACIGSIEPDVIPRNNCTSDQTLVTPNAPRLQLTKSAIPTSGSAVQPDEVITYTVVVLNDGQATANNVRITDTLPLTEVSFITATLSSGDPINGPNPLTATIAALPVNNAITMTVVVSVNNVLTGTVFTNTAQAIADLLPVQMSLPVTHVVTPTIPVTSDLTIVKSAVPMSGSTVEPNDVITYSVVVANNGTAAMTGVQITDTLPLAEVSFITATLSSGDPVNGPNPLTATVASLPAGNTITMTVVVSVNNVVSGTTISNIAQTSANTMPVQISQPVTHVISSTITATTAITINKSAIPPSGSWVGPGDPITYTVVVANNGTTDTTGVVITDTLPAEVNLVSANLSNGGAVGSSNPLTASVGTLTAGSSVTLTVVVTTSAVTTDTLITNTAQTVADTLPVQTSQPVTHVILTMPVSSILTTTKSAIPPSGSWVEPGDPITYTVVVANNGTNPVDNVTVSDLLDANVTLVTSNTTAGTLSGPNPVQLNLPTLNAGQAVTMTLGVTVSGSFSGTIIGNQATMTSTQTPLPQASGVVTHVISSSLAMVPNFTITKSADPPSGTPVDPGDTITYTVIAVNSGGPATGVVLTDAIPNGTTYVPFSANTNLGGLVYNGSALVFDVPNFPAGFTLTTTFQVTVTTNYTTVINNSASLISDQTPMTSSNVVTHPVRGTQLANVYLPIIFKNFSGPSASLVWAGQGQDRVSEVDGSNSQAFVVDGRLDGAFLLTVNAGSDAKVVDNVRLVSSQGGGAEWDTIVNTVPVLGIFDGGTRLNNANGTVDQTINGQIIVTIFGSDDTGNTRFPPDTYDYTVIVTFTDGTSVSATARIPAPPPPVCYIDVAAEITVGDDPRGVAVDGDGNRAYVANYGSDSVSVVDTGSNTVITTVTGITTANGITLDSDRNTVWVTNYSTNQITPIDATTGSALSPVSVGNGPWGVAYMNDRVYVVNNQGDSVTVIDASSRTVVATLSGSFDQPYHIAANPVTGKVYVPNFGNHTVTVINGTSISSVIDLTVGDPSTQPYGVAVDETRNVVYVATVDSHRVVAIGTLHGVPDQLLGWAAFHRGYFNPAPHRPVPMRAIAVNPRIGSIPPNMDDGGHVWTTTSTGDGSESNQTLLIPKGWISYFHSPLPCDVGINPTEGIAIDRQLDRAYVTSGSSPGTLTVFNDNPSPPLVSFSAEELNNNDITFEIFKVE